jgi:hypothetical protein
MYSYSEVLSLGKLHPHSYVDKCNVIGIFENKTITFMKRLSRVRLGAGGGAGAGRG